MLGAFSAKNIQGTAATIAGTIDPEGLPTQFYIEYALHSTFSEAATSGARSAGSGTSAVQVQSTLSSLSICTVYYFRVIASNSAGVTVGSAANGAAGTFKTTGLPPELGAVSVQAVQSTSASLVGTVNPECLLTHFYAEYSQQADFLGAQKTEFDEVGSTTSAVQVRSTLSELAPFTTYYFRLVASNSAGTSIGTTSDKAAGIFETGGPPIACEADACELLPTPPPQDPSLATLSPGLGNPPISYHRFCPKGFVKRKNVCYKKHKRIRRRHRHHHGLREK